ncbi:MAG TPA: hypothetical protein VKB81_04300 [Nitrospira sp.]|nr:hypothetical protein [Nitrospira sp.]
MYGVSPEEFFMYLTLGLIVILPIAARIYRRMTLRRTQKMLREQFDQTGEKDKGVRL